MEKKYVVSLDLVVEESQIEAMEGFLDGLMESGEIEEYGEFLHWSIEVEEYEEDDE